MLLRADGCGHNEHVDVAHVRLLPDGAQNLQTVMTGEMQIQQNHAGAGVMLPLALGLNHLNGSFAVADDFKFEFFPKAGKRPAEEENIGLVILDDEYLRRMLDGVQCG